VIQGDYERAEQYYARAIQREPGQANHYVGRGICHLYMLQRENALADVERALTIAPNNEMALGMRGDIHLMEKDSHSALEFYERAHKLNPNSALPYFGRGSVMMDKEEFQSALEEFNKAISLLALFPLFYVVRSMVHFRLGKPEAAHNDQDSALRLSEKDSLIRPEFNLQMYEGYLDWAEDYYARVILKQPLSWYTYQGRADAYRVNGEHNKAITDYTRALDINPREPRLYLGRGKSYRAIQDIGRAGVDCRQVPVVTDKVHLRRQADELLESLKRE
jgi:tetratricopeptide (TPR) repeat protein